MFDLFPCIPILRVFVFDYGDGGLHFCVKRIRWVAAKQTTIIKIKIF